MSPSGVTAAGFAVNAMPTLAASSSPLAVGPRKLVGDALAEVAGGLRVPHVLGEDRELVAAVAGDRVARPHE